MGFVEKYKKYREQQFVKKVEKAAKVIKNPKAIKEERWSALEFLSSLEEIEYAIPGLLLRFEYSLEHGIIDTREKELAMEGIAEHGEKALPYLQEWLKKTTRIAWPIKILKNMEKDELLVESLKGALNFEEVSFDQSAVDKNYDILCYLRDYRLVGFHDKLKHFLNDPDERVRFACIEALLEQDEAEIQAYVEPFLMDDSAENIRLKQATIDAFISKGWRVTNVEPFENGKVADGVRVDKSGKLSRR